MPDVTVVIPLYGTHEGRSSLRAVTAAWLAQDVPCEVVVATAGEIPVAVAEDRDAHRRVRVVRAGAALRAPGLLRNAGATQARSPMLYLSDADIAPLGRDYLRRALRPAAAGRAFAQPWMHRLPGDLPEPGPHGPVDQRPDGNDPFCFVTAASDGSLRACDGERFVWEERSYGAQRYPTPMVFPPAAGLDPGMHDDYQWRAPYHWGGLLLARRTFLEVGGYCPRYFGWGREDDDLLMKAGARGGVVRGWRADPSLACLHFEHRLSYGEAPSPEWRANDALYARRAAAGADAAIEEDLAARRDHGRKVV
ncbi:glycosyltransferase family 2 protein [Streptomyces sp. CT34]|uniref:glycosyltransferase family 2 protein n=1 Tax=Streptomyces sp. CT34 TaxID=1553907 RepID=UPI00099BFAF2|nr:glycosyltransferase family 2 protein [Streptomyces sp. CT34]